MYYGAPNAPCQAADLGFLPQSFGIRSLGNLSLSQVGTKGSRREGPAVKPGDSVMVRWVAGSAEVFVNEAPWVVKIWFMINVHNLLCNTPSSLLCRSHTLACSATDHYKA